MKSFIIVISFKEEAAAKNNRIEETREEEFEAEPDYDDNDDDDERESFDHDNDDIGSDNDDDIGSDDDDDVYDNNRYSHLKHFHHEARDSGRFIDDDNDDGAHEDDGEDNEEEDEARNAFMNKLTTAEGHPRHHCKF